MDIGMFKSSRGRLVAWILLPPLLIVGVGLSTHALRRQSEWELNRTKGLFDVLPRLVVTQERAETLIHELEDSGTLQSEDELISFLQGTAHSVDFTVDSLKVERSNAAGTGLPVLTASVKGFGTFLAIEDYIRDVIAQQSLLSESSVQVSQLSKSYKQGTFKAEIKFELVLLNVTKSSGGNR